MVVSINSLTKPLFADIFCFFRIGIFYFFPLISGNPLCLKLFSAHKSSKANHNPLCGNRRLSQNEFYVHFFKVKCSDELVLCSGRLG
jgi:hypothetical protein